MSEVFIVVGLRAKVGKEEELRRDLKIVADVSRQEDGSISYELFVDRSDPALFVFVEHWASQEQRDKHHNEGPHIVDSDGSPDGIPIKNRTRFRELTGRDSDLIPDSFST